MDNVIEMLKLRINFYKSGIELFRSQSVDYFSGEKRYHALQEDISHCEKCILDIESAIEVLRDHIYLLEQQRHK